MGELSIDANRNSPEESAPSRRCKRVACCCRDRLFDGNKEATAWALDSIATSIAFVGAGAFLAPALLKLAKDAAGCETEKPEGESKVPDCDNKIHGFKPSSLISFYATVIGLAAAIMMPLAGAIVDYTSHRLGIGRVLCFIFCMAIFPTVFISEDNWFAVSLMFAVFGFFGWFETMVLYAYLPELTDDEDILNKFTRRFGVLAFTGMVIYLASIVGISTGAGYANDTDTFDDEIGTARIAMSVSFAICVVFLSIAWGVLFQPRPAAHTLPQGRSIWTAGFRQVYQTIMKVRRHFPALKWFYIAIMFCDAATQALLVIAITFLTDQLEFSGAEIGAAILVMLIASIPGGIMSSWFSGRYNPVRSSIAAITLLIVNTTLVAALLHEPGQEVGAYVLAFAWGIGTGWKWTVDRMLYASILPEGQNTEFSGGYIFFRQVLTWLPTLVFTIMNENDVNMRWGVASLNIYFILGLCAYFRVGNFSKAVAAAHPQNSPATEISVAEAHPDMLDFHTDQGDADTTGDEKVDAAV